MIADLKPHPAMKDSGVEWLDMIPEHWEIRRMKTLLRERSEKGFPDKPLLAATQTKGVVRKEQYENRTVLALKDLHLLKLVRVGDFVISLRSFQGGIEYAREQGIISPAYTILYPVERDNHAYLTHVFKSEPYIENLSLFVTGIRQGQNIDYEKLSRSPFPYPPFCEQAAIVRFLDHADRRIRRYIRAKQKLITLLEEQKQAIINQAVTGQVDVRTGQPYPAYKPSGVEWLGDVPEHWEVRRLKTLCSMKSGEGITAMSIEPTGEYPVYGGNGLRGYTSNYTHDGNFVLIGRQGALCGNVHVARGRFWASEHAVVAALDRGHALEWFRAVLGVMNLNQYSIAAAQPGLAVERVLNLWLPVLDPQEQAVIAAHIEKQTAGSNVSIAFARREIDLLREYRTRLIADVVTGKLDVRESAAQLPDEVEELEPLDEAEVLINGEEEPSDDLDTTPEEAAV